MFNIYEHLQTILNETITFDGEKVPSYWEYFTAEPVTVPCLSYFIITDSKLYQGDTLRYSDISLRVTVWAMELPDLYAIANDLDVILTAEGLRRTATEDLILDNGLMKKVISYDTVAREEISNA